MRAIMPLLRRLKSLVSPLCIFLLPALGVLADSPLTLLHTFAPLAPDGTFPWPSLIQGPDGNFYGTTIAGGPSDAGNLFQVTPSGVLTPIYSFTNGGDGGNTRGGLTLGTDGFFYGVATYAGSNGVGTVFRLATNGVFTLLYSFKTNGVDGAHPYAALVQGSNGDFYGTTESGGVGGGGIIFEITPGGALTILHSFTGSGTDGSEPFAPLIVAADGNIYGTTSYGGTRNSGTIFRMTPQGSWTNLHSFTYGSDGALPWDALVQGTDGNFYGTTYEGGTYSYGTVFMITSAGVLTPLYSFSNGKDGGYPYGALVQGPNGNFYGTSHGSSTFGAGTNSIGTIFEITSGGSLTTLYRFTNGLDGANPIAGLVLGTNGNLFGVAETGGVIGWGGPIGSGSRIVAGTLGWGTVFTVTPGGAFTPLCEFPGETEGANPGAGLIQATNGLLYGITERGGSNDDGTVFQMSMDGTVTTLYSFTAGNDGAVPAAALVQGNDGSFYGTTYGAGLSNAGSIFKITPAGALTTLHTFTNGTDGGRPLAAMIQGTNGNFYGTTTSGGGKNGSGTVFQITPAGTLTTLHTFTNGNDGGSPTAALVQGADGSFYGAAQTGGTNDNGTIFKISTSGVFSTLYLFKGGVDGANPSATLTLGNDGNFYGVCSYGGTTGNGNVFKITPAGVPTTLYSFTGTNDGGDPEAPLVLASDGKLYGTTLFAAAAYGTIFQITTNGLFATLHSFTYLEVGPESYAAVVQAKNGNFYIANQGRGPNYNMGTILRLTVPPSIVSVTAAGGRRTITWSGETGQTYQLQFNTGLIPGGWIDLGNPIIAVGPLISANDSRVVGSQGFYRVVALP
jgi:uncharacterized repeat protein (TIGR03803 family)